MSPLLLLFLAAQIGAQTSAQTGPAAASGGPQQAGADGADGQPDSPARHLVAAAADSLVNRSDASVQQLAGPLFDHNARVAHHVLHADCHLRNLDLCYAGLLASFQKLLPEVDAELNARCDEMKAAGACVAAYAANCNADRVLTYLAPISATLDTALAAAPELNELPARVDQLVESGAPLDDAWAALNASSPELARELAGVGLADLARVCDPRALSQKSTKLVRHRLFKLGKCVNARMPAITPCLDDLKNALQLVFELNGKLQLKPTCCAIARFRSCATAAIDNVCQLGSIAQLEASLSSGPASFMTSLARVCRGSAESRECLALLPPAGMKAPLRRGRKASKIAKVLEMFQFGNNNNPPAAAAL